MQVFVHCTVLICTCCTHGQAPSWRWPAAALPNFLQPTVQAGPSLVHWPLLKCCFVASTTTATTPRRMFQGAVPGTSQLQAHLESIAPALPTAATCQPATDWTLVFILAGGVGRSQPYLAIKLAWMAHPMLMNWPTSNRLCPGHQHQPPGLLRLTGA